NECYGVQPTPEQSVQQSIGAMAVSVETQVLAKFDQLVALVSQDPLPAAATLVPQIKQLLADLDSLTGNTVDAFLLNAIIAQEQSLAAHPTSPILDQGSIPPNPIKDAAHILRPSGEEILRGETEPFANYSIFVPRDGLVTRIDFYDPATKEFGQITPD